MNADGLKMTVKHEWREQPLTFFEAMFLMLIALNALDRDVSWWWLAVPFIASILARILGPTMELIGGELAYRFIRRGEKQAVRDV